MGTYDMFATEKDEEGNRTYDQVKAFHCKMISYEIGDTVYLKGLENYMNCDIATVEGHILKIRNGVYVGWRRMEKNEFQIEPDYSLFCYHTFKNNYNTEPGVQIIDKYGHNI